MRDQATEITFNEPVQIPDGLLSPGTYWLVLGDVVTADRDTVQIFSSDWSKLYATVSTIPAERPPDAQSGQITLAERPSGQPAAVLRWFYPGRATGHEFVYPGQEERQLQHVSWVTLDLSPAA